MTSLLSTLVFTCACGSNSPTSLTTQSNPTMVKVENILVIMVAKFESKVGSQRTTKIGNLVVFDIFLVALILILYNMRFVLSSQNGICLLEKAKGENKNLKEFVWTTKKNPKNIW